MTKADLSRWLERGTIGRGSPRLHGALGRMVAAAMGVKLALKWIESKREIDCGRRLDTLQQPGTQSKRTRNSIWKN